MFILIELIRNSFFKYLFIVKHVKVIDEMSLNHLKKSLLYFWGYFSRRFGSAYLKCGSGSDPFQKMDPDEILCRPGFEP